MIQADTPSKPALSEQTQLRNHQFINLIEEICISKQALEWSAESRAND